MFHHRREFSENLSENLRINVPPSSTNTLCVNSPNVICSFERAVDLAGRHSPRDSLQTSSRPAALYVIAV